MKIILTHAAKPAVILAGALMALAAISGWSMLASPSPAYAQVPDSGAQRVEMLKEQRVTNERLAEIAGLLREIRDQGKPGDGKGKAHGASKP